MCLLRQQQKKTLNTQEQYQLLRYEVVMGFFLLHRE